MDAPLIAAVCGLVAIAALVGFLLNARRRVASARAASQASDLAGARRARALAAAARLAQGGAVLNARDDLLALAAEEARAGVGVDEALVLDCDAVDEAGLREALEAAGVPREEVVVAPLTSEPPLCLATRRAGGPADDDGDLLAPIAAVARAATIAIAARGEARSAARLGGAAGGVALRLAGLADTDAVASALAAEIRDVAPGVECVGVMLDGEPERWYPAPAAERSADARRPLFFDGASIGSLAIVGATIAPRDEELLARLADAGALALGIARLRRAREGLEAGQAALVRAAEALASELDLGRVLMRLAAAAPELVGADGAAVWLGEPHLERSRVVAVHGFAPSLRGAVFAAGAGAGGEAIARGRPVVVTGPTISEHPALAGVQRELAVPIEWGGEQRAALVVAGFTPNPAFTRADVDRCTALARLASLGLQNAEAFGERSRQGRLDRAASLVAVELAGARGLVETQRAIERAARSAFEADRVIVRLDPAGERGPHATAPVSLERAAVRERRVVASARADADARLSDQDRSALGRPGALLLVPLARQGARPSPGLVTVLWDEPRAFGDEHLQLAERLRDAAGAAVERASLEEAERRASTLSRELARVGASLAGDLDARMILRQIVGQTAELLGADACSLRLLEGDRLVIRSAEGAAASLLAERAPDADPLAAEVLAGSTPVVVSDLAADARIAASDPLVAHAGLAAYLGVPVQSSDGGVRGVLEVYDRRIRHWRPDEVEAAAALAASAGLALRNALLFESVAAEKEKGEAVLRQIADAIIATDADGRITMWNATAEEMGQLPAPRALGRELAEVLRSEFGDADGAAIETLEATGQHTPAEVRLVRGDRELWLSVTAAPLRQPGEEQPGRVYAVRDVSDERALDQLKSDFVATVSHELRTPLTSIYGFAETLLREDVTFGTEDRETFLRYIASEAERLTRLVEGLLSVTRLEAGAVQLELKPVDVAELAREVAGWARERSTTHRIELVLPPRALKADADSDRVRQVLINLIDNAIKYSPDGGTVTVRVRRHEGVVEVRVQDEGIGISERDQRNLFRKFFRVDAAMSRGIRGVGLGLYLVRGFVIAMGGRIWVESAEGKGSTFVFELPATRATAASRQEAVA